MQERLGRAWPYVVAAVVVAFVLMAIAIVVAIGLGTPGT
jgi:hypothetical protein